MIGKLRTYLVMLRQCVVAQDIALTITEFDATARVVVASGIAQAMKQADNGFDLAFIELPLADELSVINYLAATNCILLGDGAPPDDLNIRGRLDLPFTTAQVLNALEHHANPVQSAMEPSAASLRSLFRCQGSFLGQTGKDISCHNQWKLFRRPIKLKPESRIPRHWRKG